MVIDSLLTRLGLGTLSPASTTYHGRHHNWVGTTESGIEVFVKYMPPDSPDSTAALHRLITLESAGWSPVARPRCLGWEADTGLMVFELVTPAFDGGQLADNDALDEATAGELGRLVAKLHDAPCPPWLDTSRPRLPPSAELEALPVDAFRNAHAGELELWQLVQKDQQLVEAIRWLCDVPAPHTPTHCDLRLSQFIIAGDDVYLADWEELRLADPARDVGAFVGEWLFRSVLGITSDKGKMDHDAIVSQGTKQFSSVRPLITAFWNSYVTTRQCPDADLALRATAFAGWHQFDRALGAAYGQSRLLPIERAAAGIGRAVLLSPERLIATLGLAG
ncbi:class V lanthionine synthetase subunit LxmK [Amycolatopsis keratiniphila]|uniref:class V lanthionine synthetase subunit LxmK n=1 Tax=Amycolatopsis keratiniphila TaxID=129921 RepID=UPI0009DF636B|nr:class V lanthionine synthetase subunit LxmK [Amycolatopsis keratiniphila]